MSMFYRRLAVLAMVIAGTGAGIAQAQSQYEPQTTPAPTPTPTTTTVLPTTIVKVLPTPQERADKLVAAVAGAFDGITRKNLISGTKITLSVNGTGTAIVQFEVAKKGTKTYRVVGKLHFAADGGSKKLKLKIGKVGKARLAAAASKGRKFKLKIVMAIYSSRGTAKATKTVTVKG